MKRTGSPGDKECCSQPRPLGQCLYPTGKCSPLMFIAKTSPGNLSPQTAEGTLKTVKNRALCTAPQAGLELGRAAMVLQAHKKTETLLWELQGGMFHSGGKDERKQGPFPLLPAERTQPGGIPARRGLTCLSHAGSGATSGRERGGIGMGSALGSG